MKNPLISNLSKFGFLLTFVFIFLSCEEEVQLSLPEVITGEITAATASSAKVSGQIVLDGNTPIIESGVVFGKTAEPTISDSKVVSAANSGSFSVDLTGLDFATTYHIRVFATNKVGTSYGANVTFSTLAIIPEISTSPVIDIRNTTATVGGIISSDGGSPLLSRGVCWSLALNPTIADNKKESTGETGVFTFPISDLKMNTTYHIRAYASNSLGISYGEDITFQTTNLNPLYLDLNGVTIKAHDWAAVGEKGMINGIEYTIVNRSELTNLITYGGNYSNVCTSKVVDMSGLFDNKNNLQDISTWDVSNVINMAYMFSNISDEPNLVHWNTGKVVNMQNMFSADSQNYSPFNIDVSNWDVSNVTNMSQMFMYRRSFNKDLNKWNVGKVQNMFGLFMFCNSFNGDISNWNVGNVTDMGVMFFDAFAFQKDISNWNVSKVTNMTRMFRQVLKLGDLSKWDVGNVKIMNGLFEGCMYFNSDISKWNVSNVTDMNYMFSQYNFGIFNQDLSGWNVIKVMGCQGFSYQQNGWVLPKPKFINCNPN